MRLLVREQSKGHQLTEPSPFASNRAKHLIGALLFGLPKSPGHL